MRVLLTEDELFSNGTPFVTLPTMTVAEAISHAAESVKEAVGLGHSGPSTGESVVCHDRFQC